MAQDSSERLKRLNEKIMTAWEKRAIDEVHAALADNSLVLRDSLPEFLDHIAAKLETESDLTKLRVKWDRNSGAGTGKKHGNDRAKEANYTIDQLIFEYSILRQVICETMEEEAPLSAIEREVIVCAVEQAVNDAATEFSEIFTDIQERFTNTLAHDLRGPLSTAKLGAQLILKYPDNVARSQSIATRIVNAMNRVDQLISDLLDGSKLRAGEKLSLDLDDCDLDAILSHVAEDARLENPSRIAYQSAGPVVGRWNESGIRRVVENLVNNALKFSPPESCVTISLKKLGATAEISVQNFGAIIPKDQTASLFQKFRRGKNAEGKPGWGLGLTVVKGITEAHSGKVGVESSAEAGTVFKITLPLVKETADEKAKEQTRAKDPQPTM